MNIFEMEQSKEMQTEKTHFKTKLETTTTCESSHPKTYLQAPSRV